MKPMSSAVLLAAIALFAAGLVPAVAAGTTPGADVALGEGSKWSKEAERADEEQQAEEADQSGSQGDDGKQDAEDEDNEDDRRAP